MGRRDIQGGDDGEAGHPDPDPRPGLPRLVDGRGHRLAQRPAPAPAGSEEKEIGERAR